MDWLTLGMSIYAALLATIVGAWNAYGIWRDRASIKIDVVFGYVMSSPSGEVLLTSPNFDTDNVANDTRLVVRARNIGRRPLYLYKGGLSFRSGTPLGFMGDGLGKTFPMTLAEGQSGVTWTYLHSIQETLRSGGIKPPIWAYYESEAGRLYKSKISTQTVKVLLGGEVR